MREQIGHSAVMGERSTFVTNWSSNKEDAEHLRDYFLANNPFISATVVQGPSDGIWFVAGWLKSGAAPHCEYYSLVEAPYVPRPSAEWYGAPYITILCDGGPDVIIGALTRWEYKVHDNHHMLAKDSETFGARAR